METLERIFGASVEMFFVRSGGMSLSEVARIQAEHKDQNDKFWSIITDASAGVFRKVISFLSGTEASRTLGGNRVSVDEIRNGYPGVGSRNARTAVLMHALKMHQRLETTLERMDLTSFVCEALPESPARVSPAKRGSLCETRAFMEMTNIDEMIANLQSTVLAQFDFAFFKRANELNSKAAAIGELISAKSAFFRELSRPLPKGGDQVMQSGIAVTTWEREYSSEELMAFSALREELRLEYEDLQRQLNGCRKRIKDAVRVYNLNEERAYQTQLGMYRIEAERYDRKLEEIRSAAETLRQQALAELAALRIREA